MEPTSNTGSSPGQELPPVADHELIRAIGQGSYGQVWLARSITGTYRAVKIVSRHRFTHDRPFEREFGGIQKFEPISRTHPGLTSILHVGRSSDGAHFYYVMEIADDVRTGQVIDPVPYIPKTLSQLLQQGRLPVKTVLPLALALSGALAYLHDRGLVHRDLKPSNIIFVQGLPKLADIGLVTDIGEKATFVGTEGYLPPEGPGTPAADVYALGKVLYEVCTGKSREQFPELPTDLRSFSDAAELMSLNEIILLAAAEKAATRLQSAHDLHGRLLELHQQLGYPAQDIPVPRHGRPATTVTVAKTIALLGHGDETERQVISQAREHFGTAGAKVILDDITAMGLRWAREVERQISTSDVVIFALSAQSLRSEMAAYRAELARRACLERPELILIAVLIDLPECLPRDYQIALERAQLVHVKHSEIGPALGEQLTTLAGLKKS